MLVYKDICTRKPLIPTRIYKARVSGHVSYGRLSLAHVGVGWHLVVTGVEVGHLGRRGARGRRLVLPGRVLLGGAPSAGQGRCLEPAGGIGHFGGREDWREGAAALRVVGSGRLPRQEDDLPRVSLDERGRPACPVRLGVPPDVLVMSLDVVRRDEVRGLFARPHDLRRRGGQLPSRGPLGRDTLHGAAARRLRRRRPLAAGEEGVRRRPKLPARGQRASGLATRRRHSPTEVLRRRGKDPGASRGLPKVSRRDRQFSELRGDRRRQSPRSAGGGPRVRMPLVLRRGGVLRREGFVGPSVARLALRRRRLARGHQLPKLRIRLRLRQARVVALRVGQTKVLAGRGRE